MSDLSLSLDPNALPDFSPLSAAPIIQQFSPLTSGMSLQMSDGSVVSVPPSQTPVNQNTDWFNTGLKSITSIANTAATLFKPPQTTVSPNVIQPSGTLDLSTIGQLFGLQKAPSPSSSNTTVLGASPSNSNPLASIAQGASNNMGTILLIGGITIILILLLTRKN